MAGPVAIKTWKHWPIRVDAASWDPTDTAIDRSAARKKLWLIKQALIGSPGAWTVVSSCGWNGSTYQAGNTDYWTSALAVMFANAYPGSWIVLKNTAISSVGNGFQICLECVGSAINFAYSLSIYVSGSGGFTGGSTTARPTASDEIKVKGYSADDVWTSANAGFIGGTYHTGGAVFKTSDGQHTRIYSTSRHGQTNIFFAFERYESAYSTEFIPNPWFVVKGVAPTYLYLAQGHTDYLGYSTYLNRAVAGEADWSHNYVRQAKFSLLGRTGTALINWNQFHLPDVFGKWSCSKIGLVTPYEWGQRAVFPYDAQRVGTITDLWFLPTSYLDPKFATGDYYPSSSSRQFVVMGDLLQPSDGTIIYVG